MDSNDLGSVETATLRNHVNTLAVERNDLTHPANLARLFDYVQRHFESLELDTEVDVFNVGSSPHRNVLGLLHPPLPSNTYVVLAAHLDAVPGSPGADDNASGVAALLECARALSRTQSHCTICFAVTDLEEYGIAGGRQLARRLSREGVTVRAMLSLEMVGYTSNEPGAQKYPPFLRAFYPSTADFIALVGNWRSRQLLKRVARTFREVPNLPVETLTVLFDGWMLPATRLSDHAPFWDHGYPALMVTDTAFFRNPNYHQSTDTLETLDYAFLTRVADAVARTMVDEATRFDLP
jgi:Zn-dependent M28 family amino/carboxypeptidase